MRKCLAVGIILLFVGTAIVPSNGQQVEKTSLPIPRGDILYVGGSGPGNYTRIQDAIDNATNGDTVFVFDDSSPYYENLLINKSIIFIGENKETTIIDGRENGTCVSVLVDRVRISGFTIQKSGYWYPGIQMRLSNYSIISSNILQNNTGPGLRFISANNNTITDNIIIHNYDGIYARSGFGNLIDGNYICYNSDVGIELYAEGPNIISGNNISSNGNWGIYVFNIDTPGNNITGNYISNNHLKGILVSISSDVCISNNIISHSNIGIEIDDSTIVYNNSFLECGITVTGSVNSIFNNTFSDSGIIVEVLSQNNIYNNEINGKPLVYLDGKSGIRIEDAGQIILMNCNNITMTNVELSHASIGLAMFNCNNIIILHVDLSHASIGLKMFKTSNCNISHSNISYNSEGVYLWYSREIEFFKNNFIQNERDVFFIVDWQGSHNVWSRNYFDHKIPLLPKIMKGTMRTKFVIHLPFPPPGGDIPIYRVKFYFDWFPALVPYSMGV
jgi:parallel beta-helix repeat protein